MSFMMDPSKLLFDYSPFKSPESHFATPEPLQKRPNNRLKFYNPTAQVWAIVTPHRESMFLLTISGPTDYPQQHWLNWDILDSAKQFLAKQLCSYPGCVQVETIDQRSGEVLSVRGEKDGTLEFIRECFGQWKRYDKVWDHQTTGQKGKQ